MKHLLLIAGLFLLVGCEKDDPAVAVPLSNSKVYRIDACEEKIPCSDAEARKLCNEKGYYYGERYREGTDCVWCRTPELKVYLSEIRCWD